MSQVAEAVVEGTLPGRVWLYSNYNCNLACNYCLTESSPQSARRELTGKQMVEVATEARALGFTGLGVTGGEPFLRPDLPEILLQLADILPVVVLTNATLFNESRRERLRPLAGAAIQMQVSLDRPDPIVNDEMRGPGNFAKVVEAIPLLIDMGIHVRIATTAEHIEEDDRVRLCELHRRLGISDDDHIVRPVVRRGRAVDFDMGVEAGAPDLPAELTITADGAFWSPFGPTVRQGELDLDLLVTRTTRPLATPASALLRLVEGRPPGGDTQLN
ncbi:MAG: radical SAM protein, partial [Acidimicrobiia bacterium]|nr:radical SAM protein [Acidimicrobiia bacterium]